MDIKTTIQQARDDHRLGYARGDTGRDLINEAGRLARGNSAMIGSRLHILALVDVVGGALATLVQEYDEAGVVPQIHGAISADAIAHARTILERLEFIGEAEQTWIELMATHHARGDR